MKSSRAYAKSFPMIRNYFKILNIRHEGLKNSVRDCDDRTGTGTHNLFHHKCTPIPLGNGDT